MTETALATAGPADTITFINTTVVRDEDGDLSVWVGGEKILGVAVVNISNGALSIAMPMSRVRMAELVPASPVVITNSDNVIPFGRFRAAQAEAHSEVTTDGDAQ